MPTFGITPRAKTPSAVRDPCEIQPSLGDHRRPAPWRESPQPSDLRPLAATNGRIAERFTREGSLVRSQPRPLKNPCSAVGSHGARFRKLLPLDSACEIGARSGTSDFGDRDWYARGLNGLWWRESPYPVRRVAAERGNVALTSLAVLIARTQLAVPVHAPDQPANFEPDFATAVRVTTVPAGKRWLQVVPQEIPAGLLLTVPLPVPDLATVRSLGLTNNAVAARAAVIET